MLEFYHEPFLKFINNDYKVLFLHFIFFWKDEPTDGVKKVFQISWDTLLFSELITFKVLWHYNLAPIRHMDFLFILSRKNLKKLKNWKTDNSPETGPLKLERWGRYGSSTLYLTVGITLENLMGSFCMT